MGTPDFVAPEQASDPRAADVRSDLYGLGCTFYYVLTGQPPYAGATPLAKLMQHQLNDIPPLGEGVPAGLSAIIRRMMAKPCPPTAIRRQPNSSTPSMPSAPAFPYHLVQ